jgi:predicted nucleic acid-binding protein
MITAVDTNVLVDIFRDDPQHVMGSSAALRRVLKEGSVVVSAVVYAELAALFPAEAQLQEQLADLGIDFVPMNAASAALAGHLWKRYRARGGQRRRVMADFLVGAHAQAQCDRLLSRDRGFYRDYFESLVLIDPAET